jgi:hypothetical protein
VTVSGSGLFILILVPKTPKIVCGALNFTVEGSQLSTITAEGGSDTATYGSKAECSAPKSKIAKFKKYLTDTVGTEGTAALIAKTNLGTTEEVCEEVIGTLKTTATEMSEIMLQ